MPLLMRFTPSAHDSLWHPPEAYPSGIFIPAIDKIDVSTDVQRIRSLNHPGYFQAE